MFEEFTDRNNFLQRSAAFRKSQQLTRKMRRVLRRLAGFGKESEQIARIRRRLDLRQTNVAGNNGENVVKVVRYAAG